LNEKCERESIAQAVDFAIDRLSLQTIGLTLKDGRKMYLKVDVSQLHVLRCKSTTFFTLVLSEQHRFLVAV
jgi:hypothetical protein